MGTHIFAWRSKAMLNWVPTCCIVGCQVFWLDAHTMRLGTQIFAWTVTCLAWAPICCVWTPKAYGWAPIVMRWMSTCYYWVSTNMRWVATCRLCTPRFMGGEPRDYCAHPLRLRVDPQKNRQLSRIGSPHPSTKFHALPQQPTRECCVVPRVLCASPRVLRACPSVPSVLCGGAYFCACTPTCVIMCAHVIGQQKIPSPKGRGLAERGVNPTG